VHICQCGRIRPVCETKQRQINPQTDCDTWYHGNSSDLLPVCGDGEEFSSSSSSSDLVHHLLDVIFPESRSEFMDPEMRKGPVARCMLVKVSIRVRIPLRSQTSTSNPRPPSLLRLGSAKPADGRCVPLNSSFHPLVTSPHGNLNGTPRFEGPRSPNGRSIRKNLL
jgi:hypothetical protein